MKLSSWLFFSLSFFWISCNTPSEKKTLNTIDLFLKIPETSIKKSVLKYNHEISLWTLNELPYSGYSVSYYSDDTLKEKFGILNGKKQNKHIIWYPDGHLKNVTEYYEGKIHGEKKIWTKDLTHILIAHFKYDTGKPHGPQKKWYRTGEIFKKMNLNRGKEEGMQQAFRKNGDLYSNYEAREGRIFGLKKGKLCYSLKNEKIKNKK